MSQTAQNPESSRQDGLYGEAIATYGTALERMARGYEFDADKRQDLMQDIHVALWRSFAGFNGRCSLRTWVYRVAHNVAATHVVRDRRARSYPLVGLEALEAVPYEESAELSAGHDLALERLLLLIHELRPLDRQIMLLYLEGVDAAAIGEITGVSAGNVATKIHRIKEVLVHRFHKGSTP